MNLDFDERTDQAPVPLPRSRGKRGVRLFDCFSVGALFVYQHGTWTLCQELSSLQFPPFIEQRTADKGQGAVSQLYQGMPAEEAAPAAAQAPGNQVEVFGPDSGNNGLSHVKDPEHFAVGEQVIDEILAQRGDLPAGGIVEDLGHCRDHDQSQHQHPKRRVLEDAGKEPHSRSHYKNAQAHLQPGLQPGGQGVLHSRSHELMRQQGKDYTTDQREGAEEQNTSHGRVGVFAAHDLRERHGLGIVHDLAAHLASGVQDGFRNPQDRSGRDKTNHDGDHGADQQGSESGEGAEIVWAIDIELHALAPDQAGDPAQQDEDVDDRRHIGRHEEFGPGGLEFFFDEGFTLLHWILPRRK